MEFLVSNVINYSHWCGNSGEGQVPCWVEVDSQWVEEFVFPRTIPSLPPELPQLCYKITSQKKRGIMSKYSILTGNLYDLSTYFEVESCNQCSNYFSVGFAHAYILYWPQFCYIFVENRHFYKMCQNIARSCTFTEILSFCVIFTCLQPRVKFSYRMDKLLGIKWVCQNVSYFNFGDVSFYSRLSAVHEMGQKGSLSYYLTTLLNFGCVA